MGKKHQVLPCACVCSAENECERREKRLGKKEIRISS